MNSLSKEDKEKLEELLNLFRDKYRSTMKEDILEDFLKSIKNNYVAASKRIKR